MIEITAIRLAGDERHEHISLLQWRNTQTGVTGQSTREAGNGTWVYVGVCRPHAGEPYLRTHADGKWSDNLLALPKF